MGPTERQKKILRAIVDCYVRTAEPVGSKAIAEMPEMGFSSATIRNEMAALTELGLLEQPHTSAGRVPSPAGYPGSAIKEAPLRWQRGFFFFDISRTPLSQLR